MIKIGDGVTLLFTGDSITDCGRSRPVGEGEGLGDGYVAQVEALLASGYPQQNISILNTGIGGNRVTDLEARWQHDVVALNPDWLSVLIGINDVWRQHDSAADPFQVDIGLYEAIYRRLLERTRPLLQGLVLMTPFHLQPDLSDPMRAQMDAYGQVVGRLAGVFDAAFVDLQAAYDRYLAHRPAESLSDDRIHPNATGHMIIARSFLDAIGFEWRVDEN